MNKSAVSKKGIVLITRPREAAEKTAQAVREQGWEPLIAPVITLRFLPVILPVLSRYAGLVFTSAHGVEGFVRLSANRTIPAYVVGPGTAEAARKAGFADVREGPGTARLLQEELARDKALTDKALLHLSGDPVAVEIRLPQAQVDRLVIYKAEAEAELPFLCRDHLEKGDVKVALFYSPRSALLFSGLLEKHGLRQAAASIKALCLADSVVKSLQDLPWRDIRLASSPDGEGMLAALDDIKPDDIASDDNASRRPQSSKTGKTMSDSAMTTENSDSNEQGALTNAEQIIERFGGIRPMASKMAVPVTTVQGWKKRNVIPENRRADVLRAASVNNINLSDLVDKAVANENVTSFGGAVDRAARTTDESANARHREAVTAGAASVPPVSRTRAPVDEVSEDMIFGRLKNVERRAVQKSALVSVVLVAAAAGFTAFLLWPTQQQVADHGRRLGALEDQVKTVRDEQSSVPSQLAQTYASLQDQARVLQDQVANASREVGAIAGGIAGPDGGTLSQRLSSLERQVGQLRDMPALVSMVEKFKTLQQTPEGQQQMSGSVADLNALVQGLQGHDENLDGALAHAQQEDDALGRTLEGVSPYDLKAAALLLGLAQFRSSLNRSAPFAEDLALLQSLTGDQDPELNAAIERLAPQAEKGVLTPQGLSEQLKGLTGDIVVSSLKGEDVTLKEKAMARLNEVLQVQKDGQLVTGTDTQARIARAQTMLDAGDVQGALNELNALEGPAAETAAPVIDQAKVTLLAQQVQQMLTGRVLGSIGGADGVTAGGGASLRRVLGELEAIGGSHVVGSEGSGFVILPSAPKAPQLSPIKQ